MYPITLYFFTIFPYYLNKKNKYLKWLYTLCTAPNKSSTIQLAYVNTAAIGAFYNT